MYCSPPLQTYRPAVVAVLDPAVDAHVQCLRRTKAKLKG
jgi:hypothetical protein